MLADAKTVHVWIWLPERTTPVYMGLLAPRTSRRALVQGPAALSFRYDPSYLRRAEAIAVNPWELPLQEGWQEPKPGLLMPGCIRDGAPDA